MITENNKSHVIRDVASISLPAHESFNQDLAATCRARARKNLSTRDAILKPLEKTTEEKHMLLFSLCLRLKKKYFV